MKEWVLRKSYSCEDAKNFHNLKKKISWARNPKNCVKVTDFRFSNEHKYRCSTAQEHRKHWRAINALSSWCKAKANCASVETLASRGCPLTLVDNLVAHRKYNRDFGIVPPNWSVWSRIWHYDVKVHGKLPPSKHVHGWHCIQHSQLTLHRGSLWVKGGWGVH